MLKRMNINWNARQLVKMCMNGSITFDNAIQRGYVWDLKRKSLLIESMIIGYPIPAFYAKRDESKVFDMLDGKQRSEAICGFLNGEYALTGVAEEYEGKYFNDLPEEVQDDIISYSLTVYYFEDITDEEVNEMFYRLNNGKPLTAIELTRVKTKSFDKIKQLAAHPIFTDALKESQINRYTNEDIVIKVLIMLNVDKPSLKNDFIRPWITETEITEKMAYEASTALTIIKEAHDRLVSKGYIKAAKKLYFRTHLISFVPLVFERHVNDLVEFADWFFTPDKGVTQSFVYNTHCSSGANNQTAVEIRDREIKQAWKQYWLEQCRKEQEAE